MRRHLASPGFALAGLLLFPLSACPSGDDSSSSVDASVGGKGGGAQIGHQGGAIGSGNGGVAGGNGGSAGTTDGGEAVAGAGGTTGDGGSSANGGNIATGGTSGAGGVPSDAGMVEPDTVAAGGTGGTATGASDASSTGGSMTVVDAMDASVPPPVDEPVAGVAILSSDDTTSALSLAPLDSTTLSKDACLHTGSTSAKLTVPWSTNLRISSSIQPHHEIAVVDRTNATVTRVDGTNCAPIQQLTFEQGFDAGTFDFVGALPGGKFYVTRSNKDPMNSARGGDILVLDASGSVQGRIDLAPQVPAGAPAGKTWQPFPTGALLVKGKVYVVLDVKSADETSFGPGVVTVVDPATDAIVTSIPLAGGINCAAIQPHYEHPSGRDHLVVACRGIPRTMPTAGQDTGPWQGQGTVEIDVTVGTPVATRDTVMWDGGDNNFSNEDVAGYKRIYHIVKNGKPTLWDSIWFRPIDEAPPENGTSTVVFNPVGANGRRTLRIDPIRGHAYIAFSWPAGVHIFDAVRPYSVMEGTEPTLVANPSGSRRPKQLGFF